MYVLDIFTLAVFFRKVLSNCCTKHEKQIVLLLSVVFEQMPSTRACLAMQGVPITGVCFEISSVTDCFSAKIDRMSLTVS